MEAQAEGWTIVLAGHWNRMLLTPQWVGKHLFARDEIEVAFPMMPIHPLQFRADNLRFMPADERATIALETVSDAAWQRAEGLALRLLEKLPHTPVTAVGVNFLFSEGDPSSCLLNVFELADAGGLSKLSTDVQRWEIRRRLSVEDLLLNLRMVLSEGKVSFDLNFHFGVKDAEEARKCLEGKPGRCQDVAVELLQQVYDLHWDKGEE